MRGWKQKSVRHRR